MVAANFTAVSKASALPEIQNNDKCSENDYSGSGSDEKFLQTRFLYEDEYNTRVAGRST